MKAKTVVVGLSGGVDSSVSAFLLKKQGFNVIGMFMKNWEEKDENGVCQSSKEYADAQAVADTIGIPCYSVNFVKEYWDNVFAHFIEEFKQGYTPNPDILCNREIKFKAFYEKARELGADYLATGHYCQLGPEHQLLKGADSGKDQTYFLYTLKKEILAHVLFPVGHLQKKEVRTIAREAGLPTSEKKDSTGVCFIGERNFKQFLSQYIAAQPGPFKTLDGSTVGQHDGVAYYTLGQRRGMGLGGEGEAWFVVAKDIPNNVVYVERGENHPALFKSELHCTDLTWIGEIPPAPFKCRSKIRYRQMDEECEIISHNAKEAFVRFARPQRAVTPRQSIVFYDGEICLGGGIIS